MRQQVVVERRRPGFKKVAFTRALVDVLGVTLEEAKRATDALVDGNLPVVLTYNAGSWQRFV